MVWYRSEDDILLYAIAAGKGADAVVLSSRESAEAYVRERSACSSWATTPAEYAAVGKAVGWGAGYLAITDREYCLSFLAYRPACKSSLLITQYGLNLYLIFVYCRFCGGSSWSL
jgi:hypothetical protein